MPCGWEGNRRPGVALAMRHTLQYFTTYGACCLRKGDEHPTYTPHGVWHNVTGGKCPWFVHGCAMLGCMPVTP